MHGNPCAISSARISSSAAFSTILSRFRLLWRPDASEVCTVFSGNRGIRSGYSLIWKGKPLIAEKRSLGMSANVHSAPIGAQMFAIERRNHSKTGVYENLCIGVSVDTTSAVDKLKKAKKGFKFERFDVFSQLIDSSSGQQGPEGRTERGATRMGGLSFDSASPNRSLQARRKTLQIASGPASSAMDTPSVAPLQRPLWSSQLFRIPAFFTSFPLWVTGLVPACDSKGAVLWKDRFQSPRLGIEKFGQPLSIWKEDTTSDHAGIRSIRVRHSVCSMGWVTVGMTALIRKNMRGEPTRRRRI